MLIDYCILQKKQKSRAKMKKKENLPIFRQNQPACLQCVAKDSYDTYRTSNYTNIDLKVQKKECKFCGHRIRVEINTNFISKRKIKTS